MKAQGKILILILAAFLICGMGWALLGRREPWAKIQFTKAQYANDGTLHFEYDCTVSSGVFLRLSHFENGVRTGDGGFGDNTFFGWPCPEGGGFALHPSEIATARPVHVETRRTYILKLHDQLQVYAYTNKSGVYEGRFALEPAAK